MTSLETVVRELRWSAARSSGPRYVLHAALVAIGWVVAVLLVTRLMPVEQATRLAAVGIPIAFLVVAVGWMLTRPRPADLMRQADLSLGLKERLSTAWERRREAGPLDDFRFVLAWLLPVLLLLLDSATVVLLALSAKCQTPA